MSPDQPIRRRRPGGGRKPAPYSPVMAVSVSMSIDERKRIDAAALAAGRTRSAFILRACHVAIESQLASGIGTGIGPEDPRLRSPVYLGDIRPGIPGVSPITVEERNRRLDALEDPKIVWAAFGDPTRGGRWNPATYGEIVDCVACPARIPSAAVYCPSCGVEQPAAALGVD